MSDLIISRQRDMVRTPCYALHRRSTTTGKIYVTRAEWQLWFGKPVLSEERRVSWWLETEFDSIAFCIRYTETHPGCKTTEQIKQWASEHA